MWSYVTKLHVHFFIKALLSDFFLYKKLLLYHLVRWSSLNNSSQLQALNFFHIELYLRRFGGSRSASDNPRFINDVKQQAFPNSSNGW